METIILGPSDALIVVDVQNDFCPGGSLAVREGDRVVPVLNRWLAEAYPGGTTVVASRDWHPENHSSFQPYGGRWPVHCVQQTPGAEFHPDLRLPGNTVIVSKGMEPEKDDYSAFSDSNLRLMLNAKGVRDVWIGGLAQEVCVLATVIDAIHAGFRAHLIQAATRPIDFADGQKALEEMSRAGCIIEGEYETEDARSA